MPVVIRIQEQRPSGYKLSGAMGRIDYKETVSCPHTMEHIELYLKFLDVLSYDCGVRDGEFKELAGRVEKIKTLTDELYALLPRKYQTTHDGKLLAPETQIGLELDSEE